VTVVDFLKEAGLYRGTHDNPMRLGISSRSKDVIEPLLKPQWWVACGDMAARSVAAVRDGTLEIIPKVTGGGWGGGGGGGGGAENGVIVWCVHGKGDGRGSVRGGRLGFREGASLWEEAEWKQQAGSISVQAHSGWLSVGCQCWLQCCLSLHFPHHT